MSALSWMTESKVREAVKEAYPTEVVWSIRWHPVGGYFSAECASEDQIAIVKPCMECYKPAMTFVNKDSFKSWEAGEFAQRAFDTLTEDDREQIISGTHPACWNAMMEALG